jgi:hypothetical protein
MNFRKILIFGSVAVLSAWFSVRAQQGSRGQTPQNPSATTQSPTTQSPVMPTNPTTTEDPLVSSGSARGKQNASNEKTKHWTGSLVDANCMAKTLGSEPARSAAGAASTAPGTSGAPPTPHFTPESPDQLQQSGQPGGATPIGPSGRTQNPSGTPPTYPGQDSGQNPDMSQDRAARMAAADKIDTAAKHCAASASTEQFGLALSGGEVVRFNNDGDAKASEALKTVDVQPGKKIKAKVTGVMEDDNTIRVASVEVKGKKNNPSSLTAAGGEVK